MYHSFDLTFGIGSINGNNITSTDCKMLFLIANKIPNVSSRFRSFNAINLMKSFSFSNEIAHPC